ncbi:MAG TPA: hypothetical protein VMW75_24760 [Thermoanaerobaculia bacterium]|nr:hypothetical protein [Thermoanaerobaculia bacterium]
MPQLLTNWTLGNVNNSTLAPSATFTTGLDVETGSTLTFTDSATTWNNETFLTADSSLANPRTFKGRHNDGTFTHAATLVLDTAIPRLTCTLGPGGPVDGGDGSWDTKDH